MKKKITVLGCGLVGAAIARDLSREAEFELTVADASPAALGRLGDHPSVASIRRVEADLSDRRRLASLVEGADAVVGALPGRLGFAMLERVVHIGRPIADISFSPENPLALDDLAQDSGSTAVVDCGVSPGISNFAVGRAAAGLSRVEEVTIRVGGLPVRRERPFEYAIVFSASDVLEEYTRPARVVEDGRVVVKPALSEAETIEVAGVGKLEAFLTDGLRTLLSTVSARSMKEKTLRYPGHAAAMRALRDGGFFDTEPVEVSGVSVAPRALSEKLLGRAWKLGEDEEEVTYLSVEVSGAGAPGSTRRYFFELLDRTARGVTSMARTTGFPCAAIAAMLARGEYRDPGIRPLEMLARDPAVSARFLDGLRSRGLEWTERWTDPSGKSRK
ncbi:MAG TPA: saccharopine dehydrogenase C-terminal domain-containing protein [Thermoanaerobaculia bacterium]|nr:saccharopine dehydrogenase C-terminal domain-containing protein [Thermoanaerobaculia bacterium]